MLTRILAFSCLCLSSACIAQQVAHDPVPAPVFTSGSSWTYKIQAGKPGSEHVVLLEWTLLYQNKAGYWLFSRHKPAPLGAKPVVYQYSGMTDESWSGRDATGISTPTRDLLKFPLVVGNTWTSQYDLHGARIDCVHKVVAFEPVAVAAGSFDSLKIEYECRRGGEPVVQVTHWYAPKARNFARETMRLLETGEQNVFELVSYRIEK